jgi:hypothetical protein
MSRLFGFPISAAALSLIWFSALASEPTCAQDSQGLFGGRTLGSSNLSAGSGRARSQFGTGATTMQTGAELRGSERFLSQNRDAGEFVGADTRDASQMVGQQSAGAGEAVRGGGFGDLQSFMQQAGRGGGFQQQGQSRRKAVIRPALRVSFAVPQVATLEVAARIERRLNDTPQIRPLEPIRVTLQDRTALLTGRVATDHDRNLVERMVGLEAGVSYVQNRLLLADEASPEPEIAPADAPTAVEPTYIVPTPDTDSRSR